MNLTKHKKAAFTLAAQIRNSQELDLLAQRAEGALRSYQGGYFNEEWFYTELHKIQSEFCAIRDFAREYKR